VADPVDRIEAVANPDGVQATPRSSCPDPGVDLQVQVTVRVPSAGGVVAHHRGLDLLHRHLHLTATRPDSSGRVLCEPADYLARGALLGGIVGRRDLRMQRGRQRPGLRTVDDHLDEPRRLVVGA
jgi:hypothetical protein